MTIPILQDKILLRPKDFQPLCSDCEVIGTFNPAAIKYGDEIILLVRVAEAPILTKTDHLISPRATWKDGLVSWAMDVLDSEGVDTSDPRIYRMPDGRVRLRYISHFRLIRLSQDGTEIKEILTNSDLLPQEPWEELGIEDARITKIDDTYYITYVAISRHMGVATALMTTQDFKTFQRHGIIFPTENKDVVFLPEKWQGNFVAYHRPVSHHWFDLPSIEIAFSKDAISWGKHDFFLGPRPELWDSVKVGVGPPPVRLKEGWLMIYHGVSPATSQDPVGRYCVGAALIDGEDPSRLLARSHGPLLRPELPYEQKGFVPNVVFPTGALLSEDEKTLSLFSGAADEVSAVFKLSIQSILEHLEVK